MIAAEEIVLLTEKEAAQLRHQSVRTLQAERIKGAGCPFVKMGRTVRYRRADVVDFINSRIASSTAEAGARAATDEAAAAGVPVLPETPAFKAWLERAEMINATRLLKLLHHSMATGEPAMLSSEYPPTLPSGREVRP